MIYGPSFYRAVRRPGFTYPGAVFYGRWDWPSTSEWFVPPAPGASPDELETPDPLSDDTVVPATIRPAPIVSPTAADSLTYAMCAGLLHCPKCPGRAFAPVSGSPGLFRCVNCKNVSSLQELQK